jgi:adenylosuccinate lyase
MTHTALTALSPLDGRYAAKVDNLRAHFSEFALIRTRVRVEVEWLKTLAAAAEITECQSLSAASIAELNQINEVFSLDDAAAIKAIELRTNHDVKAVEYWLKERCAKITPKSCASLSSSILVARRKILTTSPMRSC